MISNVYCSVSVQITCIFKGNTELKLFFPAFWIDLRNIPFETCSLRFAVLVFLMMLEMSNY
jgi:hypothetical protein